MTTKQTPRWTADELRRVGDAEELQIASRRTDGSLRPYLTIWVVRSGVGPTAAQTTLQLNPQD